jgi:hypothetical protein
MKSLVALLIDKFTSEAQRNRPELDSHCPDIAPIRPRFDKLSARRAMGHTRNVVERDPRISNRQRYTKLVFDFHPEVPFR